MKNKVRDNIEFCPNCKINLQGRPIPKKDHRFFGATHFSRKIAIEFIIFLSPYWWQCPDCKHTWGAFHWSYPYQGDSDEI